MQRNIFVPYFSSDLTFFYKSNANGLKDSTLNLYINKYEIFYKCIKML